MKRISIPAIGAGLLLATIAFHAAQAQTNPARLVTRDELRVCMNSEAEVLARRQAVMARNQKNKDETAAIRVEQEELAAEQKKLEGDGKPMDRFNSKVKVHNIRVQVAQAATHSFKNDQAENHDHDKP